jgi:hypothetical protein
MPRNWVVFKQFKNSNLTIIHHLLKATPKVNFRIVQHVELLWQRCVPSCHQTPKLKCLVAPTNLRHSPMALGMDGIVPWWWSSWWLLCWFLLLLLCCWLLPTSSLSSWLSLLSLSSQCWICRYSFGNPFITVTSRLEVSSEVDGHVRSVLVEVGSSIIK